MHRTFKGTLPAALLLTTALAFAVPAQCQEAHEWDAARARLQAGGSAGMSGAIEQWKRLSASGNFAFQDYASFMLTYPGFPDEAKMRVAAERAVENGYAEPRQIVAFFDRYTPVTNPARAQYALALASVGRGEAASVAKQAWRGGPMSDAAEAAVQSRWMPAFTTDDHDARVDALLWAGDTVKAGRWIAYASPAQRAPLMARMAVLQGSDPGAQGLAVTPAVMSDPGYVFARSQQWRKSGQLYSSVNLLSTRPPLSKRPLDTRKWIAEQLVVARAAGSDPAVSIAAKIDDTFAPGTDVSRESFMVRDDYTSLMWLGGTQALWNLGSGTRAAPLFYRYGAAARTPQTRSKGFYWAGRSMARAGNTVEASRYFEMAAQYPDQYYGLLALERLGRSIPPLNAQPNATPTAQERAAFQAQPLTRAVREVARYSDWGTAIRFFREVSDRATTPAEHVLVAELARELGRRDLAVIVGQAAGADSIPGFVQTSFPTIPVPGGVDWTMAHALTRQESQFAMNAVSHAGARGLMQLMPGTAREQAGKLGMSYDPYALMNDASYNMRLGGGYFARMMDYYGGSYPLAIAAYNAGPGNVNKWLRANGDPRNGGIDWVEWIERIPVSETRNYVQRVTENAVVYQALNPVRAIHRGPNPLSQLLGKRSPG